MQDAIIEYLWRSGWVRQSVEEVIKDIPRWERQLRARGVTEIPTLGMRHWDPTAARAHNEINLLMRQGSKDRDAKIEHDLRNLTRRRPYKA